MQDIHSFPVSTDSCSESLRTALKTRKEYLDTLRKEDAPQDNPIQYKQTLLSYIHLLVSEMSQITGKNREDISTKSIEELEKIRESLEKTFVTYGAVRTEILYQIN